MFAKIVLIACVQFAIFDVIASQCIKNVIPSCGCGCGGVDVINSPLLLNQGYANVIPSCGCGCGGVDVINSPLLLNQGYANVIPGLAQGLVSPAYLSGQYALPAANVIQDNSVANNLANTLQLLLVSNLLSNTLPLPASTELILPSCSCGNGLQYFF